MAQHFAPPAAYNVQLASQAPQAAPALVNTATMPSIDTRAAGYSLSLKPDPAFAFLPSQMKADWVTQFGCRDLGVPPGAPTMGEGARYYLDVTALCKAAQISLPEDYPGKPHIAGPTCPCCAWMADNQGLGTLNWFVHPQDKAAVPNAGAKPPGRSNVYIHQTHKCGIAFAIAHVLVRRDRDAGRG